MKIEEFATIEDEEMNLEKAISLGLTRENTLGKLQDLRVAVLALDCLTRGQKHRYSDPDLANVLRTTHMLKQLLEAGAFDRYMRDV